MRSRQGWNTKMTLLGFFGRVKIVLNPDCGHSYKTLAKLKQQQQQQLRVVYNDKIYFTLEKA